MQARLFKSLKLWSFYVDLEESIGTVDTTKAVYDKILELRIANAQVIINYAAFLEDNKYFEESFKVSIADSYFTGLTDMHACRDCRFMNAASSSSRSLSRSRSGTSTCQNLSSAM